MVMRSYQGKNQRKPRFLAVDFFCGAGGTTRGLLDAGGYVIAGIDHDIRCKDTYEKNNINKSFDKKPSQFLNYDIFKKSKDYPNGQQNELFKTLHSLIGKNKFSKIPLLFAVCAPCQPFTSLAHDSKMSKERISKRKRDRDLLLQALNFIREFKPDAVLSENVAGISDPRYSNVWENFKNKLQNLGYAVASDVICASKFGVPQNRKRSILLAVKKSKKEFYGSLKVEQRNPKAKKITVEQAIGHLPELQAGEINKDYPNHLCPKLSDINLKRMLYAIPGESNQYLDNTPEGDLSLACHRRINSKKKSRCFSDVYTRMHPNRPSPTITTKCHSISNGRFGHYNKNQLRAISVREAALLQSFPENYIFYPADKVIPTSRMIGNAVPPKLAEFFANYLIDVLAKTLDNEST